MTPTTATPKQKPGIMVRVEPEILEVAKDKAAATGSTVNGVLRALLKLWINTPTQPLTLPTSSEDQPAA